MLKVTEDLSAANIELEVVIESISTPAVVVQTTVTSTTTVLHLSLQMTARRTLKGWPLQRGVRLSSEHLLETPSQNPFQQPSSEPFLPLKPARDLLRTLLRAFCNALSRTFLRTLLRSACCRETHRVCVRPRQASKGARLSGKGRGGLPQPFLPQNLLVEKPCKVIV